MRRLWVDLKLRNLINIAKDGFDFKHLSLSSNVNEGFVELREMEKKPWVREVSLESQCCFGIGFWSDGTSRLCCALFVLRCFADISVLLNQNNSSITKCWWNSNSHGRKVWLKGSDNPRMETSQPNATQNWRVWCSHQHRAGDISHLHPKSFSQERGREGRTITQVAWTDWKWNGQFSATKIMW